ncbi:hypothetical protein EST38_g4549 [Candolleomyces aberdarensis]|uniref:HhH-GPD domain-containing protein n=1 Tax=Candolleomyces aberdarensis TaxID=2316362 RepID=A0A4Q2DMQ3_9AGAR|nr:hypothetical protein EST38_g4549 [Candolleomyces aberdarensis]
MPATRSSSRLQASAAKPPTEEVEPKKATLKRKAAASSPVAGDKNTKKAKTSKKTGKGKASEVVSDVPVAGGGTSGIPNQSAANEDIPVPAVLSFDFEQAKNHLINVDSRFQDLFSKMSCRPFEHLEQVHPFRALAISILGQQISWKAARSITHKFIRLYNPDIPEQLTDETRNKALDVFPSPHQVVGTDLALLRTAGLSARKAEYIQDLAGRFADGRLSTEKLLNSTDEELAEMLIQVKGIGRWTVDMFAIFSLRRPDVLPVGDLGVQRGVVRWFLSQHSPAHPYGISPEKIGGASSTSKQKKTPKPSTSAAKDEHILPAPGDAVNETVQEAVAIADGAMADGQTSLLPTPFTPSIRKTLSKVPTKAVSLPGGLTVSVLKGRLDGKKVK